MRIVVLGASVFASLTVAAVVAAVAPSVGYAQRPPLPAAVGSQSLIALSAAAGEHRQQVVMIDPSTRVMSVYHVDLATGDIGLKCVRNITWDLQMMEFNGSSPKPSDVRSMVEQR